MEQAPGPGTRLGGYEILAPLGAGSMGMVFRALQVSLSREVALKVFSSIWTGNDAAEESARFLREGRIQARLSHPNLVKVHDHGSEGPWFFIAMDLISGRSLEAQLRAEGPLPASRAVSILRQAMDALEYLHRSGVEHRDIKPANILIDEGGVVRLADFGLARSREDTLLTRDDQVLGTLAYMAPEVLAGQQRDEAADVYSMGVVFYRTLSGEFHHVASSPPEYLAKVTQDDPRPLPPERQVPRVLQEMCLEMLARDPARRPSAAKVRDRLKELRSSRPTSIEPSPPRLTSITSLRMASAALVALIFCALWLTGRPPVPPSSPVLEASATPGIPPGDPRSDLLERYRTRLANMGPAGRIELPGRDPETMAEWFWHHRARRDGIDPSSPRGWFLVYEVALLREVTWRVDARSPPHAVLRVNGKEVALQAETPGGATWIAQVPPSALRRGLNHWSLPPSVVLSENAQVRLAFDPPDPPRVRTPRRPLPIAPDAAFLQAEDACRTFLHTGMLPECKECFAELEAKYRDKDYASWQTSFIEGVMARVIRDLDQTANLVTGADLVTGNVRGPPEAGAALAESLDMLARSLERHPEYGQSWSTLGEVLASVGETEMAWGAVMYACIVHPDDPWVWLGPAAIYRAAIRTTSELRARKNEIMQAGRTGKGLGVSRYGAPLTKAELSAMEGQLIEVELDGARTNWAR